MNQKYRKYFLGILAILFAAALICFVFIEVSEEPVTIVIYHTNDMHGQVADLAYVMDLRAGTPNSLLVDAGDPTQGTLLATVTNGTAIMTLMNFAGYDVMTLGNHEFDKGAFHAAELSGLANFPVLSANTFYPNGTALLNNNGSLIIETAGKRIGFFGITTTETNGPYSEFICNNEISAAKNQTMFLEGENVDLIVALVHIGNDPSSNPTSYDLAAAIPEIDLIIDGHSHTIIQDKVGNTTIVQTGAFLANLGMVNITFTSDGHVITTSLIPSETLKEGTFNETYAKLYADLVNESSKGYEQIVGNSATALYANSPDGTRLVRLKEMPLGNFVADSLLWYGTKKFAGTPHGELPAVALMNGGGVRTNLAAGNITLEDAYTILPFGNFASIITVSSADLYAALENGVSKLPDADGRFSQVSGMRITVDVSKDAGERIISVEIPDGSGWKLLERSDTKTELMLCTINYITKGSEGYEMLAGKRVLDQSELDASVFAEYALFLTEKGGGSFTYEVAERIHMI